MMTAMQQFFSMIWTGLQGLVIPPFNISAASLLLGIFVVDVSITIFSTIIHIYAGTSHALGGFARTSTSRKRFNKTYNENVRYHNAMINKRYYKRGG